MSIVITEISPLRYSYCNVQYETLAEVEAAVLATKDKLDNKPTTWCVVKRILPVGVGHSYNVPADGLLDAEILSLDAEGIYKVSSDINGTVYENLTATQANEAIQTERTIWAQAFRVHEIDSGTYKRFSNEIEDHELFGLVQNIFDPSNDPIPVTNADMSEYI